MDGLETSSAFTRKPSALVAVWDPGRRTFALDLTRLLKFSQDDEVAQRVSSSLALECLLGESCHTDKVALSRKVLTRGLACLIHCVAARQHGDDTAGAHGGHGPLDHIVVKRYPINFNSVGVGDVAYGGVK